MKKRLGLVGAGAVAALAFASVTLAAYSPTLTITRHVDILGGSTITDIAVAQTAADDPTAAVAIYAPAGFSATLNQPAGTQIGTLEGFVIAGAFAGAQIPVGGTVATEDPTNAAVMAAAKGCTGTETHTAVWRLHVTAAGQTVPEPVRMYVDALAGTRFEAFASTRLQLCLAPAPVSPVNTFGIKLLTATLHMTGIFSPPAAPGAFRWTAANVPYASDSSSTVNVAGSLETQSIDPTPVAASLSAKLVTKTRRVRRATRTYIYYSYFAKLTGLARRGGQGAAGATVDIMVGDQKVATKTTNANGSFSLTRKLTKTTTFHAVYSQQASPVSGASCQPALPFGNTVMPCGVITQGGFSATTANSTVRKPKVTVRVIKNKKKKGK